MWKIVIILMYLCGTTLATPVVGLKKNMEIIMADDVKTEQMSEEKEELMPSSNEKSELAMTTLNLPSNATSIRADIVDGFSCKNREYGYYADVENDCQIFHVCMPVVYADGKENTFRWSFICPEETVFSQDSFTCMRAEDISFGCEESVKFYELNRNFGLVDSSMEIQSNEAESNSEMNMMSDKKIMHETMTENKNSDMQKETTVVEGEKIQKIQKRVDELKPETPKPFHKKKNSLRKNPVRKVPKTTTTAIPITTTTTEQATPSAQPTTSLPLEVEITTAKIIEKLTTKYQRFTRRPDINKENKKKIEQIQKAEPVTVGPIKDSTKKPFKPESSTVQKRKRPHIPSSLKHKFNGEEKPFKNILKTSEIVKITPNEEQQKEQNVPVKILKRPPIPEPILIKVEEQPAEPIKIVQTTQQTENFSLTVPEITKPLLVESESPVVSFTKPETEKINQIESKPISASIESADVNNDSNKKTNEEFLKNDISSSQLPSVIKQNENDVMNIATATLINNPDPTTVINMNIENIPSQESEIKTDEQKTVSEEKIEESMPPKKEEELLEDRIKNESNNEGNKEEMILDNNKNEAETLINDNKNAVVDNSNSDNNNQQSGIDQQSMIINLISSLVNAENSKVDDVADKIENSEYVLPQTEQQNIVKEPEAQEHVQTLDINNVKLFDEQQQEQQQNEQKQQEQQQQDSNNEFLQMTTNNILSDDKESQNNEEIINSDRVLKVSSSTNNEDDHLVENLNSNQKPEVNDFNAMQKFIHQQHELYNHMTHIPVKLLTDDQYEDIQTKGALTNSDALNVIQRIEQLLQDEVKADDQSPVVVPEINNPIVLSETEGNLKEENKASDVQQSSSEEIKPIYHRYLDPIEANLLKDNVMSIDENKPIIKDTVEPSPLSAAESVSDSAVKSDVTIPEPTIIETPVEVKLESEPSKEQPSLLEILKIPLKLDSVKEEKAQKSELLKIEVPQTIEKEVEQVQAPVETVVSESIALKQEPLESEISSKPEEIKLEKVPVSEVFESEKLKSEILPESTLEIKNNLEESNASNTDETTDDVRISSRSLKHKSRIVDPRKRRFLFKADA